MTGSTKTKTNKSSGMMTHMRISEIASGWITNQKLVENNYLQWNTVIEIYVVGRQKTNHLLADHPAVVTDAWTLDDILLYQILTTMKLKIQDLVLHCMTIKELWSFLRDLYGGSNNINMAYDIIHELFRKKQNGHLIDDHYIEFNRLAEEFRQIFLIRSDVK